MKNNILKINSNVFEDISIIGICTNLADYKLAWFINNQLSFNFVRENDIMMNGAQYAFFFYNSDPEGNEITYNLVSLTYKGKYWRTALPHIDFLLIIRSEDVSNKLTEIQNNIHEISGIGHTMVINPISDKELTSILQIIENHEVNILKNKDERKKISFLKEEITNELNLRKKMFTQSH